MLEKFLGGSRYIINFIDDATWLVWAYSLKMKDEALETFTRWCTEVELQGKRKLKILLPNNGGEYFSRAFSQNLF